MSQDLPRRIARVARDPVALRRALARRLTRRPGARTSSPPVTPAPPPPATPAPTDLIESRTTALLQAPHVDVVVPVGPDVDAAVVTLRSILRWSEVAASVLVAGPHASEVVAQVRPDAGVAVRPVETEGSAAAVAAAITATTGDLTIVAPGSEVGPSWLRNLRRAAHALPRAGIATALSDLAHPTGAVTQDPIPPGLTVADVARLVARRPRPDQVPVTPLAIAPACYVRRGALEGIEPRPLADVDDVPSIIADLGLQADRRGWLHVVDDATWVHVPPTSPLRAHPLLEPDGPTVQARRHPDLADRWRALRDDRYLAEVVEAARARWSDAALPPSRPRPRVLYVLHEGEGGTPATAWDLARHVAGQVEPFVLTSDTTMLRLSTLDDHGEPRLLQEIALPDPLVFLSPTDRSYRAILAELLDGHAIDTVHIRHLYRHTLDAPEVAKALGCRVVLSLHDSYLICPTIHLLDDHGRFCGGVCTPGVGRCQVGPHWLRPAADSLKHGYVHEWQRLVARTLEHVDAVTTTSTSMAELFRVTYPHVEVAVIEHGRDLAPAPIARTDTPTGPLDRPLRVLVPGFLAYHKGGDVLRRIAELDTDGEVELHLLGHVERAYRDVGIDHGRYGRDEFRDRVAAIEPDVAAVLSVCAESYCHTLTESWAAGLPVVGTSLGAVGERIDRDGGGWVVDTGDPEAILGLLRDLRRDPGRIGAEAARIDAGRFVPASEMAADHLRLTLPATSPRRRVAVLHPDEGPDAAAHLLAALRHPSAGVEVVAVPAAQASLIAARIDRVDVVLLAAGATPGAESAAALAEAIERSGTPLVLDLDGAHAPPSMLASSATTRIVGAPEAMSGSSPATIVPPRIDEYAWLAPIDASAIGERPRPIIGWVGEPGDLLDATTRSLATLHDGSPTVDVVTPSAVPGGPAPAVRAFRRTAAGWDALVIAGPFDRPDREERVRLSLATLGLPIVSVGSAIQERLHADGLGPAAVTSSAEAIADAVAAAPVASGGPASGAGNTLGARLHQRTLVVDNPLVQLVHELVVASTAPHR